MSKSRFGITIGVLAMLLVATSSYGDVIFYLSPVTALDGSATLGNANKTVITGEAFSLGVWVVSPVGGVKINGIALDIIETASLLNATGIEIMESGESGTFARWEGTTDGNTNLSTTSLFSGSNAVGVETAGLSENAGFRSGFDGNWDATAGDGNGAFLYAIIHLTAGGSEGTTFLFLSVGEKKIGYSPDDDSNVSFGIGDDPISRRITNNMSSVADATINVIPEPTVMGLLAIGGLAVIARRKRR